MIPQDITNPEKNRKIKFVEKQEEIGFILVSNKNKKKPTEKLRKV